MSLAQKLSPLFVLIVAGVLSLSSVRPASAQGNGTQHFSDAFSVTFFDDCTGEFVDINVTLKEDVHVVVDKAGGFHLDIHDVYSGRGVGETTGTIYIANQTDSLSVHASAGLEETAPLHFSMISKGGGDNVEVRAISHVTVNANGDVTAFVDHFSVSCKGK